MKSLSMETSIPNKGTTTARVMAPTEKCSKSGFAPSYLIMKHLIPCAACVSVALSLHIKTFQN
jgi:hypothetical protein